MSSDEDQRPPPPVVVVREKSAAGFEKEIVQINDLDSAKEFLKRTNMHPFEHAKGLFLTIIVGTFIIGAVFVGAGIALVYLDAQGTSEVELFGAKISSTNVGVVSIFIGGVIIILVIRNAMKHINLILRR